MLLLSAKQAYLVKSITGSSKVLEMKYRISFNQFNWTEFPLHQGFFGLWYQAFS